MAAPSVTLMDEKLREFGAKAVDSFQMYMRKLKEITILIAKTYYYIVTYFKIIFISFKEFNDVLFIII